MSCLYRITNFILKRYFHLFYNFSFFGIDQTYKGKAILAPNHASFLDPPLIGAAWPEEIHFLARESLFRNMVWGWILSKLNAHPVKSNVQDIETFRLIRQLLEENKKVVIFPEGERSVTGQLQNIKSGIAMLSLRMQCPIIPIYISGSYETWPRHSRWPKFGTSIICVFGKPIFPNESYEGTKREKQENMTLQVKVSLENLRLWLENGAKGEIP